ncbi:MAG: membrane protein insertase YidC [Leptospira sp.]|nr:membrane protein insertase YidC [Leptospira sp.]NCS93664.1 membrane protein insertase YidC [Leptospira sp.]
MQERQGRLFLALFLSLGIWLGIQYFFFPPELKKVDGNQTSEDASLKEAISDSNKDPKVATQEINKPTIKAIPSGIKPVDPASIKKYYIKTEPYLIELSSLGGRVEKFFIQNHKEPDGSELQILKDPKKHTITFENQEYVAIEISRQQGFDFNLIADQEKIPYSSFNERNFSSSFDEAKMTYEFQIQSDDKSYILKKIYQFFPNENYFIYKMEIRNLTNSSLVLASPKNPLYLRSFGSLGPFTKAESEMSDRDKANFFRYYYLDDSFKDFLDGTTTAGFLSNIFGNDTEGQIFDVQKGTGELVDFAGTGSRYFIAVLDPLNHKPEGVLLDTRANNTSGVLMNYDDISIEAGKTETYDYAAYVGIREADGMAFRDSSLDPKKTKKTPFYGLSESLDKSFNQGLTTPFRNGIVWILKKIYTFIIPNYGWAIILFAILFKAVFFPLNQKQADSMKKMQELSPQIKEINEKYEKDPQLKQQKIMELYKTNKVNPMGGCLPMLIQIPIFIALYTAFSDTVDLWESPFLWVNDLSEPDTVYTLPSSLGIFALNVNLLPLVMVGSQILQSRFTVVSTDPNQKMMMYLMPLVMLYFFWSMPSGVTLYWTIQNILSILQQLWTNKFGKDKKDAKQAIKGTEQTITKLPPRPHNNNHRGRRNKK